MPVFDKPPVSVPASIGPIQYEFADPTGAAAKMEARAWVRVLDASGGICWNVNVNNLIPFLTTAEKGQLFALFTRLRQLAVTELLT